MSCYAQPTYNSLRYRSLATLPAERYASDPARWGQIHLGTLSVPPNHCNPAQTCCPDFARELDAQGKAMVRFEVCSRRKHVLNAFQRITACLSARFAAARFPQVRTRSGSFGRRVKSDASSDERSIAAKSRKAG